MKIQDNISFLDKEMSIYLERKWIRDEKKFSEMEVVFPEYLKN